MCLLTLPVTTSSTRAIPFEIARDEGNEKRNQHGRWTENEHQTFLKAMQIHGHDWKTVAKSIHTRTPAQVRSHAQKYLDKLTRRSQPTSSIFWNDLLKAVQVHRATEQLHEQYRRLKQRLEELDGENRVASEDTGATKPHKGKGQGGNEGTTSSSTSEKMPTATRSSAADNLLLLRQELDTVCILQNQFHTLTGIKAEKMHDENHPPTLQVSSVVTVSSKKRRLLVFKHGETCQQEKPETSWHFRFATLDNRRIMTTPTPDKHLPLKKRRRVLTW